MSLEIRIKQEEMFFFSSYILYLCVNILQMSFYYKYFEGALYDVIIAICLVLLIIGEFIAGKINLRVFWGIVIVSLLAVLILHSGNGMGYIVFILVYGFCARKMSIDMIVNVTLFVSSFLLGFIVLSSYVGIIDDYVLYTTGGRIRHYLGFRYSLYAPTVVFNIVALVIYKYKEKINYLQIAILFITNMFVYNKTQSRLTFITTLLLLVLCVILKYKSRRIINNIFTNIVMVTSFLLSFVLSIYFCAIYNPSIRWMSSLDSFLGRRISLGNLSLEKYGVGLLGQVIKYVGNGLDSHGNNTVGTYFYVDNFYIQILQRYGLIFTFVILIALTIGMIESLRNDYYLLIISSIIALHGIIDDLILILGFNTFWIPIFVLLLNKRVKHKSRESKRESGLNQGISG